MEPNVSAFLLALSLLGGALAMNQQPTGPLPPEARCYFDAVAAKDINALTNCFDAKAVIIDVDRRIEGTTAIRTWAKYEVIGGTYKILEVSPRRSGVTIILTFAPGGGSGFRARYEIDFSNGKIVRMNLQYA